MFSKVGLIISDSDWHLQVLQQLHKNFPISKLDGHQQSNTGIGHEKRMNKAYIYFGLENVGSDHDQFIY